VIDGPRGLTALSISDLLLAVLGIQRNLRLVAEALEFRDDGGNNGLVCKETLCGSIHVKEVVEDTLVLQVSVHLGKKKIQLNKLLDERRQVTTA